jgi:hypothetical protein
MLTATTNWKLANNKLEKQPVYRIVIGNYYRTFSNYDNGVDDPWLISIEDLNTNINDLDGGADQETLQFSIQDHIPSGGSVGWLTTDMGQGMLFEGQLVKLYVGFTSMASTSDYLLLWQGYIDQVDSANCNLEYSFKCSDVTSKLQQTVYLTGDNGGQTSSENIKTLTGHPLEIMLDICQSQLRDPASGQALDQSLIDTAKIQSYIDGPFQGMEFLFHLDQAPVALDFIKNQILKPLGGYLWVNQGMLTVNFFYPLNPVVPVQTVGEDDWLTVPTAEQTDMVNTVQFSFDKDDSSSGSSGNYLSISTQNYGPSVLKYGLYGSHQIAADGLRAALQGYLIGRMVAYFIFGRYGLKNLKFDQDASDGLFSQLLLQPGDLVAVTHPLIPDRKAGSMGVTGAIFECLGKKINFTEGLVTMTMIDGSYLKNFGFREIAPDGQAVYTSSSTGDKAQFMFQSSAAAKYSNGDAGGVLG